MSFVIFQVKNIKYAIDTNYVKEMINIVYTEPIKDSFVDCLLNYHGKLVPTIEASKLFDLYHGDYNQDAIITILNIDGFLLALLTDNVDSLIDEIKEEEFIKTTTQTFSIGAFKYKDELVYLLNLGKILREVSANDSWRSS